MQYTFVYDEPSGICTIRVTGENRRPGDSIKLQQFTYDYHQETGCDHFLFDMTGATIIGDTVDEYNTGIALHKVGFKAHGPYQIALVYSGDLSEHKFMEDVLINRGYNVRVFNDMDKATDWIGGNGK